VPGTQETDDWLGRRLLAANSSRSVTERRQFSLIVQIACYVYDPTAKP